jgi:hypothetical protein
MKKSRRAALPAVAEVRSETTMNITAFTYIVRLHNTIQVFDQSNEDREAILFTKASWARSLSRRAGGHRQRQGRVSSVGS